MCSQLPALIEAILIKLSIDSGGGFDKLRLFIFDINDPYSKFSSELSKKSLGSGVKRVFIIRFKPNIPDLFLLIGVDSMQACIVYTRHGVKKKQEAQKD